MFARVLEFSRRNRIVHQLRYRRRRSDHRCLLAKERTYQSRYDQ
jgi:hypothetical protein